MSLSLLRRSPILRSLPQSALKQLLKLALVKDFSTGADIFAKAAPAEHMFIVTRGRVKIFTASAGRKRKTFCYLGPGKFFGEMALLDGRERSAAAQAVTEATLLVIAKRDFHRVLLRTPKLALNLLKTLSFRLRKANEEIESLMFRNILGRVSKTLYDLAQNQGKRSRGGMLIDDRFTHQELADLVGTTREPLSRALAALRRAELVAVRHGQFFLPHPEKMRALIGD